MTLLTSAENHLNRATQDIGFFGPGSSGVYIDENGGVVLEHETGQTVTVKDDFDVTGTITGTLNLTQLQLEDDEQLQFGSAPDYWWEYESANTRLRLRSSDIDGGGTDGDILRVLDGTQNIEKVGGQLLLPDGSAGAPGVAASGDTDTGVRFSSSGVEVGFVAGGNDRFAVGSGQVRVNGAVPLGWTSGSPFGDVPDLELHRDAADTLALRRGANGQAFRLYNTFTDDSNYERLNIFWSGDEAIFQTAEAGTGAVRSMVFAVEGTTRTIEIGGSGGLGFFGATPVAQPTTAIAEAAFTENAGGAAINVDSEVAGYTFQQVVQALLDLGILA